MYKYLYKIVLIVTLLFIPNYIDAQDKDWYITLGISYNKNYVTHRWTEKQSFNINIDYNKQLGYYASTKHAIAAGIDVECMKDQNIYIFSPELGFNNLNAPIRFYYNWSCSPIGIEWDGNDKNAYVTTGTKLKLGVKLNDIDNKCLIALWVSAAYYLNWNFQEEYYKHYYYNFTIGNERYYYYDNRCAAWMDRPHNWCFGLGLTIGF